MADDRWWEEDTPGIATVPTAPQGKDAWWNEDQPATLEQVFAPVAREETRLRMESARDMGYPNLYAGLMGGGASAVAPVLRAVGDEYDAAKAQAWGGALDQHAERMAGEDSTMPIGARAVRGVAASLPSAVAGGRIAGPYGAIGAGAVQEADSSFNEARLLGKPKEEAAEYGKNQGVIEFAIAGAMQKLGLGGLESVLGQATAGGVRNVLARAGQELAEENATELAHAIEARVSDMNPEALTPENLFKIASDTTAQTLLTMGIAEGAMARRQPIEQQPVPETQPPLTPEQSAATDALAASDQAVAQRALDAESQRQAAVAAPVLDPAAIPQPDALGPRLDKGRLAEVSQRQAAAQQEAELHPDLTPAGPPQEPRAAITNNWQELPEGEQLLDLPGAELYTSRDGRRYMRLAEEGESLQQRMDSRVAQLNAMTVPQLNQEGSAYGLKKGLNKGKKIREILDIEEQQSLTVPGKEVIRFEEEAQGGQGNGVLEPVPPAPVAAPAIQPATEQVLPTQPPVIEQPPIAEPPAPPVVKTRKPVTRAAVARTFPGAEIVDKPNGWTVKVGQSYIDIDAVESIAPQTPKDWKRMEEQLGRPISAEQRKVIRAAGSYSLRTPDGKQHDGLGIIRLAYGDANDGTLRHEALHLAHKAGLLKPEEWAALVKEYGDPTKSDVQNEELVAQARASWTGAKTVWDRIRAWLRRMLASFGVTPRKAADVMQLLDEAGFWQRRAEGQEQGTLFEPARHDLANPGTTQGTRDLVDQADQQRTDAGEPQTRPDSEVQAEAAQRLEADYAGEKKKLLAIAKQGGQLRDTDTVIAKSIVNREGIDALMSGDKADIQDAISLIDSYRRTGTEQGRAFRQRRDPIESPAERMRRNITEAILTPPPRIREQIEKARGEGNQAEIDRLNKAWADKIEAIKEKLKSLGVDLDNLNEWGYSPLREAEVIGIIDPLKSSLPDAMIEYWRNAILSAPTTQAANLVGNFAHGAWSFTAERFVEAGLNKLAQRPEGAQVEELKHILAGILPGVSRGARNFLMTWRTELPTFDREMASDPGSKLDTMHVAIPGRAGKVIRWPQRLLLAADQFSRAMFSEMEVGAQAYRIAKEEGLEGEPLRERIAELTSDIESKAWGRAYKNSLELTFQQSGGRTAQHAKLAAGALRNIMPYKTGHFILPFVTFPINMLETAVKKSPLGAVQLSAKMYANYRAGKPVMEGLTAQAAQQVIAGAVLLALLANDEDEPWITGAESSFRKETRELSQRIGRPPQSIKIGGTWYSYTRIEPFATILASMVDATNSLKSGEAGRMLATPLKSLVGQVTDKTFLSGLSDIYEATHADNVTEGVGRWASNFAVSWVPNIARSAGRSIDDSYQQRGVWGNGSDWWAMLMHRTLQKAEAPVGSEPIHDLWGREIPARQSFIPRTDWLYRMTIPVDNRTEDIFVGDKMILKWNMENPGDEKYPTAPQRFFRRAGKTTYFTDEQYADFTKLSGTIARQRVESVKWPETPTERDMTRLGKIIEDSRAQARNASIRAIATSKPIPQRAEN